MADLVAKRKGGKSATATARQSGVSPCPGAVVTEAVQRLLMTGWKGRCRRVSRSALRDSRGHTCAMLRDKLGPAYDVECPGWPVRFQNHPSLRNVRVSGESVRASGGAVEEPVEASEELTVH